MSSALESTDMIIWYMLKRFRWENSSLQVKEYSFGFKNITFDTLQQNSVLLSTMISVYKNVLFLF